MRSYIRQYNKLLIGKSMNLRRISASCFCLLLAGNLAVSAQTVTLGYGIVKKNDFTSINFS